MEPPSKSNDRTATHNEGNTPMDEEDFTRACQEGDMVMVQHVFQHHDTGLHLSLEKAFEIACGFGNGRMVQWILENTGLANGKLDPLLDAFLCSCSQGNHDVAVHLFEQIPRVRRFARKFHRYSHRVKNGAPLHFACKSGNMELVQWLVRETNAMENHPRVYLDASPLNVYPLVTAAREGHWDIAKWLTNRAGAEKQFLLRWGVSIRYNSSDSSERCQVIRVAVHELGADVNKEREDGAEYAAYANYVADAVQNKLDEVVKVLLEECGADPNFSCVPGLLALDHAVKNEDLSMVQLLVKHGAEITDYHLRDAVEKENMEILKFLLEEGEEGVGTGSPLIRACEKSSLPMMKLLVKHGANVSGEFYDENFSPLHMAVCNEKFEMVKFLLKDCNADVNARDSRGRTPLFRACGFGLSFPIVKLLVKHGANVNDTLEDEDGITPLFEAVWNKMFETVQFFVEECNADVNTKNDKGETPIFRTDLEMAKHLVKLGADVHLQSLSGESPLLVNTKWDDLDSVKFLVEECGVDVNQTDADGETALFYACAGERGASIRLVDYFLGRPDINLAKKNHKGQTAYEYATLFQPKHLPHHQSQQEHSANMETIANKIQERETRLPKLLNYLTEQGWWADARNSPRKGLPQSGENAAECPLASKKQRCS